MKNLLNKLLGKISTLNVKKQLLQIYCVAIVIPVLILGCTLMYYINHLLTEYYHDMVVTENTRIRMTMFELTTQVYNLSEELSGDELLQSILNASATEIHNLKIKNPSYAVTSKFAYNYAEIQGVEIYSDNKAAQENYSEIQGISPSIREKDWYKLAMTQSNAQWVLMSNEDKYGNVYYNLSLVRNISAPTSRNTALLVIRISDNYMRSRMQNSLYTSFASVGQSTIFYSSDLNMYGMTPPIHIDYDKTAYQYDGKLNLNGKSYMGCVSTLYMYQTDSRIYACTYSTSAYEHINKLMGIVSILIVFCLAAPLLIINIFVNYFNSRIYNLRNTMRRVSNEDYTLSEAVNGNDELSEVYSDLVILVDNVKSKEAAIYESKLKEQEFINTQQKMEFKMLSAQINPHFLYNTLETIRMKAFTAGNREVATAIKLLGKSMRYVLENTGTSYASLKNELDYIDTYVQIQKLRFEDKVNYHVRLAKNIKPEEISILPLLLQPIVENSISHGLKNKEGKGHIYLKIYTKQEDILIIQIFDDGIGMTAEEAHDLQTKLDTPNLLLTSSIGVYNIHQRIKLCYGADYGLTFLSRPNHGTLFTICIPCIPANTNNYTNNV